MLFLHNKSWGDLFKQVMKAAYIGSLVVMLILGMLAVIPGCEEESQGVDERAQEQRFFELYMSSTFRDTIAPPTQSGLYYIEVKEGSGDAPDDDDWLMVNYVGYILPDETVVDTYLENVAIANNIYSDAALYGPFKLQNGSRTIGLTEGLLLMREGGQAILCFTSDLGYGAAGESWFRMSLLTPH